VTFANHSSYHASWVLRDPAEKMWELP